MKYLSRLVIAFSLFQISSAYGYENQCAPLFANGVETYTPGEIKFDRWASLKGGDENLAATTVKSAWLDSPCDGSVCRATGIASGRFPDVSDANRPQGRDKVSVRPFRELSLHAPEEGLSLKKLELKAFSKVLLRSGDYWIDNLTLGASAEIIQEGAGQIRIFANSIDMGAFSRIGDQSERHSFLVKTKSFRNSAFSYAEIFLYSESKVDMAGVSTLVGSLAAPEIKLKALSSVTFNSEGKLEIDYGWICDLDNDGIYDGLDEDADNDGFSNQTEVSAGTDPWDAGSVPADTDGDGKADIEDEDIDGDGYSNEEEIEAGTDPYDPDSFPLPEPPQILITTASGQVVMTDRISIAGRVTQGDLALASVVLEYLTGSGVGYPLALTEQGYFTLEVALIEGENRFRVTAKDADGYTAAQEFLVTYVVPFSVDQITPPSGFVSDSKDVQVSINVTSTGQEPVVRLDGAPMALASVNGSQYQFTLVKQLAPGDNDIRIQAIGKGKSIELPLVYRFEPENNEAYPAPEIHILRPVDGQRTRQDSVAFSAEILSSVGRLDADLSGSGVDITLISEGRYSVAESVTLQEGSNQLILNVTDALGQQSTVQVVIEQDKNAPDFELNPAWQPVPALNLVADSNVLIAGLVNDNDVSGITVNGMDIPLIPYGQGYQFSKIITIPALQDVLTRIVSVDSLGNKKSQDYRFYTESNLQMSWISPAFPVTWFSETGTGYPFAVKLEGVTGSENFQVTLEPSSISVGAQQIGNLLTGVLPDQLPPGDYQLVVRASYGQQKEILLEGDIRVINQEDLPLQVVRIEPESQQQGMEPDTALQINFNRPVNPELLTFSVYKTLHGKTYVNQDEPGTDFLHAKGQQLQDVNYSRSPVSGGVSLLKNDSVAVFYPQEDLGYGAKVEWEVKYDGESVARQIFSTRSLPTFIEGGVVDSFGQQRSGLVVKLDKLGLSTLTNNDGGFSFGFGSNAENNIPGGDYQIIINADGADQSLGVVSIPVSVAGGRRNKLPLMRVPNRSNEILPVPLDSDRSTVRLASGDLQLDLDGAALSFPGNERTIHSQFVLAGENVRDVQEGLAPLWFYQQLPFGIAPEAAVNLNIRLPAYRGGFQYLPFEGELVHHVLILGYNPEKNIIEPVGVGKIENKVLTSTEPVKLSVLDYIGYSQPLPAHEAIFTEYLNKNISFIELVARISQESP